MPYRPPRKTKRPDWNTEPDYHQREGNRLALAAQIREEATHYLETDIVCPGCDTKIWEAHVDGSLYRGCHCMTFMAPQGHPLGGTPLDLAAWERRVYQNNALLALNYRRMAVRN
jgi:hypothetical protein